jgi:putative addiction module killer protein
MRYNPMNPKELRYYQRQDGLRPFNQWLVALKDAKTTQRILARLNRIRSGNLGDCRAVGEGVCELRIHFGPGYRIYFGQDGETLILLICAGEKDTQPRDLRLAHAYWRDYKERKQ